MTTQKIISRLICVEFVAAVLVATNLSGSCHGQGILGKRFISASYLGGQLTSDASEWFNEVTIGANTPLNETWDLNTQLSYGWYSFDYLGNPHDVDAGAFNFALTKHFFPEKQIDPFVSYGVIQAKATVKELAPPHFRGTFNSTVTFWRTGAEIRLSDRTSVIPSIRGNATLDEILEIKDFYFNTDVVHWWNERWLGGVSVGSNFEDNNIGIGGFIGFSY